MLSIVIPIYNEEGLIDDMLGRTVSALDAFTSDYEIIVVDDAAKTEGFPILLNGKGITPGSKCYPSPKISETRQHLPRDWNMLQEKL